MRPAILRTISLGGSGFLFGALMLSGAVAFGYHMILARIVSPAEYGIFVTLVSISYVLDVLLRTIQASVTKTVATMRQAGGGQPRAVLVVALRILVPLAFVAFIAQWLSSGWIAGFLHLGTPTPVIMLALYASTCLLVPVPRGILLGLGRLHGAGATLLLDAVGRVVAGVAFVLLGLGVNGAISGFTAGNVAGFVVGLALLWRGMGSNADRGSSVAAFEGVDRYTLQVLVTNSMLMVMASIDQVVVSHFFSAEITGNYAVAFVLGRLLVMTATALAVVIFTRSAAMQADDARRAGVLIKGLLIMGAIAFIATAALLALPAVVVRLVAGTGYAVAPQYIGLAGIEMALFGLLYVQAYYHISVRKMQVAWPLCAGVALEIFMLARYHASVQQVLLILILIMLAVLVWVSGLSWSILRGSRRPARSNRGQAMMENAREI